MRRNLQDPREAYRLAPVHTFPRPTTPYLVAEREPAAGVCPECGGGRLADYRVLSEGGWWDVRKCQDCLHSLSRVPAPPLRSYTPLGLQV